MLQILSLIKWSFIQIPIIHDNNSLQEMLGFVTSLRGTDSILQNNVSPIEHCYGSKWCYVVQQKRH